MNSQSRGGHVHRNVVSGGRAQGPSDLGNQCRYRDVWVFPSVYLLTQESDQLRLIIFEIYSRILAKVSRKTLEFPLKHQVINSLVLLASHLKDVNADVVEVRSQTVEPGIQFPLEVNAEYGKPLDRAVTGWCHTEGAHSSFDVGEVRCQLSYRVSSSPSWSQLATNSSRGAHKL